MDHVAPKKFVKYSYSDSLEFKQRVINTWKPASDVWAFKHGDDILASLTAFGSIYITYVFRKEMKLRPFATLTCYLPIVGLSSISTAMFHSGIVTGSILSQISCPSCISTKASLGQVLCGIAYPLLASPAVCFYVADKLLTYPIPPLARAPREVFLLYQKIVKKYQRSFFVIGAIHMVAAYFMTSQKNENWKSLNLKYGKV